MSDARYLFRGDRGFVEVRGDEARTFLQGVTSNDVAALEPGRAQYNSMLTPQGRLFCDFLATADEDGTLRLECPRERVEAFVKRLSMYRLRAKVEIRDASAEWRAAVIFGEDALERLGLPREAGAARGEGGGTVYADPRHLALGARAVLPVASAEATLAEAGLESGAEEAYQRLRLESGVPEGPEDLPPERALPMEVGFDELNALSWTKGCYMGQELTARMRYRALIKKRLLPVEIAGAVPPPGTPVFRGGAEVGEVRSSAGDRGLAILKLDAARAAADGGEPLTAGEARLTPRFPDWLRIPEPEERPGRA